jgi:hypothetical protein
MSCYYEYHLKDFRFSLDFYVQNLFIFVFIHADGQSNDDFTST